MGKSKHKCGILPYLGSASYIYKRMPMGLNVSSVLWYRYINSIVEYLQSKNNYLAIIEDLSNHGTKNHKR